MTSVSQFFEPLKVGFLISYLSPLIFVLTMTMLKEAYDDYQRYKRDKEANSYPYKVITQNGYQFIQSAQLKVGQIIEINANERIPADLILIHAQDKNGSVFIRTDQLDGETDWKLRKSIRHTQSLIDEFFQGSYEDISMQKLNDLVQKSVLKLQEPCQNIYEFEGTYKYFKESEGQLKSIKEPLGLENSMWANTVLASSKVLGMVIYAGNETRMQMNSKQSRSKFGKLEMTINYLTKLLFLYLLVICLIMVILKGGKISSYTVIVFLRYILLLCSVIPISMRVNLDFAKLIYCYRINVDDKIQGTIARNSNIPEELGRIKYLLSDKTGTLTQNDMIFKKLSLEQYQFSYEDTEEIKKIVQKNTYKYQRGIMEDVYMKRKESDIMNMNENSNMSNTSGIYNRKINKREKDSIVRDCINALALCHNVTPVVDKEGVKTFQASSPDEIALVKTAEDLGVILKDRNEHQITLINSIGIEEKYNILANFPFSSESKRMGIVLQQEEKIIFLLKGADVIMKNKVPEVQRGFLLDECEDLSRSGLRTLCFAYKYLEQDEYNIWDQEYKQAQIDMKNRKARIEQCIEQLEQNMQFLCITGVEDKLQLDVSKTIENLRNAGINIWMLTGDKMETAKCIAISGGLRNDPNQNMFEIKEIEDQLELNNRLNEFYNQDSNTILVIDGTSLAVALRYFAKQFIEFSCRAPAVVCCRCSPTQKAEITTNLKIYTKQVVASIGDGGNDVGMIQCADVGIGIVGKEGKQAALAADFSINQFNYLNRLLLWHGRNSYKRSATLGQFVMHRGLIISTIQTVFTLVFYFVTMSIYNGMLNLGYSTIFTNLPIFCLIFDEDVNEKTALEYPPLYETLQKNRDLNLKTFLGWCFKSLYQGTLILILGIYMYSGDYFVNMVTITFTCLILTEFLNVYSELHSIHIVMIISQFLSVLIYFMVIILMPTLFDVSTIDGIFLWKMLLITLISWFPFHLFKMIKKIVDPTDYEKIMKGVQTKILNRI